MATNEAEVRLGCGIEHEGEIVRRVICRSEDIDDNKQTVHTYSAKDRN